MRETILQFIASRRAAWRATLPGLVLALALLGVLGVTRPTGIVPSNSAIGGQVVVAEIEAVLEAGEVEIEPGKLQRYQVVRVRVLEGEARDMRFDVDYGRQQLRPAEIDLQVGERIIVVLGQRPDGARTAYFADYDRTQSLAWLAVAFAVFTVLTSGWKGLRGLLGMGLSFAVIVWYILPHILLGDDPVAVSVSGAFMLLAATLYLVYGWTLKTHVAVLGTLLALIVTGILSSWAIGFTRLTGYGSEDALYLMQQVGITLNLRGLLLGGMVIGALGVLDDLTTTQAAVVFELYLANPDVPARTLYSRAMQIGKDHIAATVNTLVLAYTGASLPLLLLLALSGEFPLRVLSQEFVAQEIVRTLVGSLGLMSAVPLTTGLACLVTVYHDRLEPIRRWLGPGTLHDAGDAHGHTHGA